MLQLFVVISHHHVGGGLCATAEDCEKRSTTDLGSSKNWRADFDGLAIFSSNKLLNPDFYEWNHVFIPVRYITNRGKSLI